MPRKTRSTCSCGFDFTAEHNRHRRVCGDCGQKRVPKSKPKHEKALETPYEEWVARFGERCGICGKPPVNRKLDRDHWHTGPAAGEPRGLLCWYHNKLMQNGAWTPDLLRAAAAYLERAA